MHDYVDESDSVCGSCFMSRQSRAPCTFLNPDDMIMGSGEKITEGLDSVLGITGDDVVLVETIGASIQVVDREASVEKTRNPGRTILSDQDLSSMSFSDGFDDTMLKMVRHLGLEGAEKRPKTVNILGYGMFDSGWEEGKEEIAQLLGLIGVEVIAFVGCDDKEHLKESNHAAANILIHPETSRRTAAFYESELGIPFITPTAGSPIGYPSIRSFITEVARFFDSPTDEAMEAISNHEKKLHRRLANVDRVAVALHGYGMMIDGLPSDAIPIISFMKDLLGLVPERVKVVHTDDERDIRRMIDALEDQGCGFAYDAPVSKIGLRAYFSDGLTVRYFKEEHQVAAAVGYMMPFAEKQNFISRAVVGLYGCSYLVDQVINGQDLFFCDQPVGVDFR